MLLGLLEAGFLPGCIYLISTWYTRYELQKRLSVFYSIGFFASGLGGILAYGLMQMVRSYNHQQQLSSNTNKIFKKGLAGLNGWRWIFIMEGLVSLPLSLEKKTTGQI